MKRLKVAWVYVLLNVLASWSYGADCSFVGLDTLKGWQSGLAVEDVVPYQVLGIRSKLLCAAKSPGGSFVFVTLVDSGNRPPQSIDDLDALITRNTFASWNALDYLKRQLELQVGAQKTKALWVSVVYPQTGYGIVRLRKVYVPMTSICGSGPGTRFLNHMYVISYWGPRELQNDVDDYEDLLRRLSAPEPSCKVVSPEVFGERKAIFEEARKLAAQIDGDESGVKPPAVGPLRSDESSDEQGARPREEPRPSPPGDHWPAEEEFLRVLDDAASNEIIMKLDNVSKLWQGTVVGDIGASFLSRYQQRVASRVARDLLARVPASVEGNMAAAEVLLAGIRNGDQGVVDETLSWLRRSGVTACSLEPEILRELIMVTASAKGQPMEKLREFLKLPVESKERSDCLLALGLQEPNDLRVVKRKGGRLLVKGVPPGAHGGTVFIVHEGQPYLLQSIRKGRGEFQRMNSLLDLASSLGR